MKRFLQPTVIACLFLAAVGTARAEPLPKSVPSSPCKSPPSIDGEIAEGEWRDAKAIDFDMEMLAVNPPAKKSRACSLWVMNSANALYIAFRVPDTVQNATLNPLDFDLAILGFCRGTELKTGDDRKVIAPGLYSDKHFVAPNKDGDDKKQDGRGAVKHDKGVYTFEWAIPLDSGDDEDLRAKPGDSIRFNLAYFDSFKADLNETQAGSAYGGDMNKADTWGTIELAAKVDKDDGSAFRGPAWAEALIKNAKGPAARLRVEDSESLRIGSKGIAKILVAFDYRDPTGAKKEGKAAIYFPTSIRDDAKVRLPLSFAAGYEINDQGALALANRGFVVVTPRALEANPLIRTVNPDVALMHMVRSLPFIDDAKVLIAGGSAGGYMTLMLAAETFPIAIAMPDVPPVNWGYNAAYFFKQKDIIAPGKGETIGKVPVLQAVGPMLDAARTVYGEEYGDATWYAGSPVAHVSTITCPVSVWWTTADILVPFNQVGAKWVKPFDAKRFPANFTMDPEKLTTTKEGQTRLLDVLKESDYEIFEIQVPKNTLIQGAPANTGKPFGAEFPMSATKQWSILIADEGPPEPQVGHNKYAVNWNREKTIDKALKSTIAPNQLTLEKLTRLMDRYAGKEWLPSKLKQLDEPESEKADVIRGLRTYVKAGAENAKRFAELYGKLPAEKRVLTNEDAKALVEK